MLKKFYQFLRWQHSDHNSNPPERYQIFTKLFYPFYSISKSHWKFQICFSFAVYCKILILRWEVFSNSFSSPTIHFHLFQWLFGRIRSGKTILGAHLTFRSPEIGFIAFLFPPASFDLPSEPSFLPLASSSHLQIFTRHF